MRQIKISSGSISQTAFINDDATADAVWDALPITAQVNTWGDEIYFNIPVDIPLAHDAKAVVDVGTLGYWPPAQAFCIFYGKTPASIDDEIRAASAVNIFGKVQGDATIFKRIKNGDSILIESVPPPQFV